MEMKQVKIGAILASKENPRTIMDRAADKELLESVRTYGVKQPVIVKAVGNDQYELLDGYRRWTAARAINPDGLIDCIVESDDASIDALRFVLNSQREKMHPMDEAKYLDELIRRADRKIHLVAHAVQKSEVYIKRRVVLMNLIDAAKKKYLQGQISHTDAFRIARETRDVQEAILKAAKHGLSAADVTQRIHCNLREAPFPITLTDLSDNGDCASCRFRSGNASQDLFDDITDKEICLAPKCYHEKSQAWAKRILQSQSTLAKSMKMNRKEIVLLSERPYLSSDHPMRGQAFDKFDWQESSKALDENQKPSRKPRTGIIVDGKHAGKVVECYLTKDLRWSQKVSKAEAVKQKKEKEFRSRQHHHFREIVDAIRCIEWPTARQQQVVADDMIERARHDVKREACRALSLQVKVDTSKGWNHYQYDDTLKNWIKVNLKLPARIILFCTTMQFLDRYVGGDLKDLANKLGIKVTDPALQSDPKPKKKKRPKK